MEISPAGTQLFVDLIGGTTADALYAISVDSNNNLYFTGYSTSAAVDGHAAVGMR